MDMGCFPSPSVLNSFPWRFKVLVVESFMVSVLLLLPHASSWCSLHLELGYQWCLVSILFIIWSTDFFHFQCFYLSFLPPMSTSLLKCLLNFDDFLLCFPGFSLLVLCWYPYNSSDCLYSLSITDLFFSKFLSSSFGLCGDLNKKVRMAKVGCYGLERAPPSPKSTELGALRFFQ